MGDTTMDREYSITQDELRPGLRIKREQELEAAKRAAIEAERVRLEEERENRDPDMVDDNALTVVAKARALRRA